MKLAATSAITLLLTGASAMSIPTFTNGFLHTSKRLGKRANKPNPMPAIIGGTIGGFSFIILVAVVVYLLMRRKEDRRRNDPERQMDGFAALERAEEERKRVESTKMAPSRGGILGRLLGRKKDDVRVTEMELESVTPPSATLNNRAGTPVEMNTDPEDVGASFQGATSHQILHSVIPEEITPPSRSGNRGEGLIIMTNDDTVEQILVSARASRAMSGVVIPSPDPSTMPGFSPVSPIVREDSMGRKFI
ncbi:hypothetical protein BJ508DRAFT_315451 [Ascobolus immersus RN42]|uniref:Uncharacterized protein n=1 Tax=Ascobolus immersus RN42 TaxID=1160509 RepID=A0A3N4HPM8_ASCIM|nr:hypothetical protein BJ508DRAFT_315451 [Ascobolus immersus RN42]